LCGLTGIVSGRFSKRRLKDIEALADIFTRQLLLSEHRGPHATGVAWLKRDGAMQVAKEPLPARDFVQTRAYLDWLLGLDRQVTYLMGHTRWPSRGSVHNPANNHPICLPVTPEDHPDWGTGVGCLALTHNGTLVEVARHFSRLGLARTAQVDSELLARIAQRHTSTMGIDLDAILADLAPLEGRMSLALATTCRPDEIILLKGNMPLEIRLHRHARVLYYASETQILDRALGVTNSWEPYPLAPGEGLVIDAQAWTLRRIPFTFHGIHTTLAGSVTGASREKETIR
jgi:amidophosphoribosyltransferase